MRALWWWHHVENNRGSVSRQSTTIVDHATIAPGNRARTCSADTYERAITDAGAMTRLLIAEDDYLVREGARSVLGHHPHIEVLGTAGDADELRALLERTEPDVVLLDIRMPPTYSTEGIALAREIRRRHPQTGIVVLSQHDDPEYVLELLEDGADGVAYLLKERLGDASRLVQAIEEVAAGGSVLDPRIVTTLLEAQRRRSTSTVANLTPRELEVLTLMATGKGNAAIARELSIAERSVEKHSNAIFRKLGLAEDVDLNRRVAAVLFFLRRSPHRFASPDGQRRADAASTSRSGVDT